MDFQGKCIQFIGETTGTSKAGNPWKKKEWVMETFGQYPRKVKVQCFGDRSDSINLEPGRDYTVFVDLESREFNGRWYTDVSVYRAEPYTAAPQQPAQSSYGQQTYPPQGGMNAPYGGGSQDAGAFPPSQNFASESSDEDLPF